MSPAAQALASSKLRTSTDKALRASYSPSPGSSLRRQDKTPSLFGLKTPTPTRSSRSGKSSLGSSLGGSSSSSRKRPNSQLLVRTPSATPELEGMGMGDSRSSSSSSRDSSSSTLNTSSLTDNLLNLPKKSRSRADDFFWSLLLIWQYDHTRDFL